MRVQLFELSYVDNMLIKLRTCKLGKKCVEVFVVIILNLKIRDKSCDFNFIIKKNNNNNNYHKSLVLYNNFTMFDHKSHLMTKPNTEGFQDLRFFKKEKLQMELHLLHVSTESLFASYYFLFKKS